MSRPRKVATVLGGGRWSLVDTLVDASADDTSRTLAHANQLLDRYGLVSREIAAAESISGGFSPLYKVLSALEETGRVRRGYFIEGLSGAQFARPGTIDRIRDAQPAEEIPGVTPPIERLPAVDPANPWGAALPWPETGGGQSGRPKRVPGAWLLLHQGQPVLYLGPRGRQLITFPSGLSPERVRSAAFAALQSLPKLARRGTLLIEKIDGRAVAESPYLAELLEAGFVNDYRGVAAEAFA
jgi:ATP-dependent Lhr-like helicase